MAKNKFPMTQAIRFLKSKKIDFEQFVYDYTEKGGTAQTSVELNVDEHKIIKTLVFISDKNVFIVLMHGDNEVSQKELARQIGVKSVEQCDPKTAMKHTGYQFGGTSPFGTKKDMQTFIEESIFDLDDIYINGGKQGFIVKIKPYELQKLPFSSKVNVSITS